MDGSRQRSTSHRSFPTAGSPHCRDHGHSPSASGLMYSRFDPPIPLVQGFHFTCGHFFIFYFTLRRTREGEINRTSPDSFPGAVEATKHEWGGCSRKEEMGTTTRGCFTDDARASWWEKPLVTDIACYILSRIIWGCGWILYTMVRMQENKKAKRMMGASKTLPCPLTFPEPI